MIKLIQIKYYINAISHAISNNWCTHELYTLTGMSWHTGGQTDYYDVFFLSMQFHESARDCVFICIFEF